MAATLFKLRCPLSQCHTMEVTIPSGGVTAGDMAQVQNTVGIYLKTNDAAAIGAFLYRARKVIVPKDAASGITFAQGAKVYFDSANAEVTNEASGTYLCGVCLVAAVAADASVEIELDGLLEVVA